MKVYVISMVVESWELEETYKKIIGVKKAKSLSEEGIEISDLAKKIALTELENLYKRCEKDTTDYEEDYIQEEYACMVKSISPEQDVVSIIVNFQEFFVENTANKLYAICNYDEGWFTDYMYGDDIELQGINFGVCGVNTSKEGAISNFNTAKEGMLDQLNAYLTDINEIGREEYYICEGNEVGDNLLMTFKCHSIQETNYTCSVFESDID